MRLTPRDHGIVKEAAPKHLASNHHGILVVDLRKTERGGIVDTKKPQLGGL